MAGVKECPVECPTGMIYKPDGANPPATCENKAGPDKTRGCFCPDGKVMQNNKCIDPSQCQCVHEEKIYRVGETITKEAECQECTCLKAGRLICRPLPCPIPKCKCRIIAYHYSPDFYIHLWESYLGFIAARISTAVLLLESSFCLSDIRKIVCMLRAFVILFKRY